MTEANTITRQCTKCGVRQDIGTFHNDKSRPDGKFPWCRPCVKAQKQEIYVRNTDEARAKRRADYQKNKEAYKARAKKWAAENPEKRRGIQKDHVARNPEKRSAQQKVQREKNPGYYRAHFKMRQQRKKNAIPGWADLEAIEAIYRQCQFVSRMTGVKHHVDHYFPLTSDVVCGLHVSENLRIIPATENLSKGNKLPE